MIEKIKLEENEKATDNELPESVLWDSIVDAPQSVADLNYDDGVKLESIDGDGNFIKELISATLNTQTKLILGEFQFQSLGAIAMKTDANNGLWLSPTGILGKKAGATTFAIDTSGNATFSGTITSSTITGGTVRTSSGTTRVEMNGSDNAIYHYNSGVKRTQIKDSGISFFNSSGTLAGIVYGIQAGEISINAGGSDIVFDEDSVHPNNVLGAYATLGLATDPWKDLYLDGYIQINTGGILFVERGGGSNNILLRAPSSLSADITLTLPTTDGASGEFLQTDGAGNMSWASPSASGANTALSNLASVALNTTFNANGQSITNCGYLEMDGEIDMGAYDINCTAAIQLAGGGYIDDARAIYLETGRTNNPSISGEMRYYDGTDKGFRCYVNGFLGQIDLTAK